MPVISWGDVPTWALAVIALLALIAAVAAYFKQADAADKLAEQTTKLGRQVDLQQQQFDDQQEANRKRGEVLDAELREIRQRAVAIERQQADSVVVAPKKWSGPVAGFRDASGPDLRMAMVHNESPRPIRNVTCRLQFSATADTMRPPCMTGPLTLGGFAFREQDEADIVPLMRASTRAGFVFAYEAGSHPDAKITARFTDDAGLHWQIDPDLHLQKLDNRDDW